MQKDVTFFLPTRKGSERVKNKNTRPFAGFQGGILELKLTQLLKVNRVKEIILSTNDPHSIEVAKNINTEKIKIIERPEYLCLSSTLIEDLINYIPTVVNTEHIFWVHTTTPFMDDSDYSAALDTYFSVLEKGDCDCMFSVTKLQAFLWDEEKKDMISYDRKLNKWPRSQDIKPLYEVNHAFYLNSKTNFIKYSDRITNTPYLYCLDKLKALDIDWEDDFELAEVIYSNLVNRKND